MRISLSSDSLTNAAVDILVLGARSTKVAAGTDLAKLDKALGAGALAGYMKDEGFTAKRGQVLKVPARGRVKANWVVLVGLGKGDASPADARIMGHAASKASNRQKSAAMVLPTGGAADARAAAEGLVGGAYRYSRYFTGSRKPKGGLKNATLLVGDPKDAALKAAVAAGRAVGEATNAARDLVNAPPNDLNPPALADFAAEQAAKVGIACEIWDKKQIEDAGMRLLLAVNAGSGIEPRVIHMAHSPENPKAKVVFVGKGLTFDSGGLCLKPAKSMIDMKCDMAGAAITIGIVLAAARLKLPIEVHAVIGSTENMNGDHAYRPGDVFKSLDGKTVEIINTDAEGRLVLADVLAYARDLKPDYMIDHATLTGACMVALGPWRAGMFTDDDELANAYDAASSDAGESYWRMPLDSELRELLDSPIADLKHTGSSHGGAITAALFLKEFVGRTKWMHVDVAGPSWLDSAHGLSPKGGTGFGVATGVRFLESLG